MATYRVAHRERYTQILDETLGDERLSFRARGLLAFLLSKPDDWSVNSTSLARMTKEGRDAIRSALKELRRFGYVVQRQERDPDSGRWSTVCDVHERPQPSGEASPGHAGDVFSGAGRSGAGDPDAGDPDAGFLGPIPPTQIQKTDTETASRESASDSRRDDPESLLSKAVLEGGHLADARHLCDLLAASLRERGEPRARVTKKWLTDMEALLRIDGQDPESVERVIRWLDKGSDDVAAFWRPNVRSPGKLRSRYAQMREQYQRLRNARSGSPNETRAAIAELRREWADERTNG